jgi:hypothetical protein
MAARVKQRRELAMGVERFDLLDRSTLTVIASDGGAL